MYGTFYVSAVTSLLAKVMIQKGPDEQSESGLLFLAPQITRSLKLILQRKFK
jgi:hypothetical protein